MKKFQYRLEPLLKVKSEIEKQKQKELADVQRRVVAQREKIEINLKNNLSTQDSQRQKLSGKVSVAEMLIYTRHLMKLKRQKLADKEMLRILDGEFEKKRQSLLAATVERKKFDRLKEIQKLKHLAEFTRQEALQSDEHGRISHLNKIRGK